MKAPLLFVALDGLAADALICGMPIMRSEDPVLALRKVLAEMVQAKEKK